MESKALISALQNFEVADNHLMVAGRSVTEWTHEYGTPCYLYDSSIVRRKIALFRDAMPAQVKLFYAVKANPHSELLKAMMGLVDGFDVASTGELEAVIKAGGNPQTISFAGPGKRRAELSRSIKVGIGSINIESERELDLLVEEAKHLNKTPNVSIRVNPDFELHGSGMKMGGGPKQFGVDAERVPDLLEKAIHLPVNFQGFHIFSGSQNLKAAAICDVLEQSLDLMWRLAGRLADSIKLLNLGGGFGIPYFEKDEELDIFEIGRHLESMLQTWQVRFPKAQFVIELGRYLVGECGLYVTSILYKKVSRGKTFLVIDGGMNHHIAASGNFGQVLRKNYPIVIGNKMHATETEEVNIVGPLCTPLDLIGSKVSLPVASEGDLIAVLNSGAYGYTASPLLFLGHPLPKEILLQEQTS